MLQHVSLLTETKGSCANLLLITACLSDKSTCISYGICKLKKPMPSDSRNHLQETRKLTQCFIRVRAGRYWNLLS